MNLKRSSFAIRVTLPSFSKTVTLGSPRKPAVAAATSPELVNDGPNTAPSKRIIKEFPEYLRLKTTVGVELATLVGLDKTRQLCPHFDNWLGKLETLASP